MKGRTKTVIGCAATVITLSMLMSMGVFAAGATNTKTPDADVESSTASTGIEDSKWSYRAVADVMTQVNIRAKASTESAIIGYLPKCASADIIERGEEWSHIISGGVEGYVKNEFLAYGEDAKSLASVYGTPGVETYWDGVNVFAAPDGAAKIVDTVNGGKEFEVINEEGDWILIQLDDATMAYIPAEDVKETTILDRAIPVVTSGTETEENADIEYTAEESSDTYETQTYESEDTQTYESSEENYTEESSDPAEETSSNTDQPVTESTEAPAPDTSADTTEANTSESEVTVTNASTDDVTLLAALIYCEAGNQSREGKVAVGAVVLNRVASPSFPGTIKDVIYQSGQFTPAYSGALARALANGVSSSCYEAAQAALNGEDPVPGALYFNGGSGSGVRIGDHQFY